MKQRTLKFISAISFIIVAGLLVHGQVSSTGSLSGAVTDPSGAAVAGAAVTVKDNATNAEFSAQTADNGTFTVPALNAGTYTVTITAKGFKQAVVQDVKVDAARASSITVALEVGAVTETVTIVGGGGELLQTQSANVSTTITGRQITELPFTSRDALDLVLTQPGVATVGRPRASSVNGLPKGSLNITLDGVNTQDNLLKSSDGFFTYIRPRIDAIDEVTVSTATPGAESSGEGAVQIKFVTRSGTNDYRGSVYWYHRNPALNANYFFNNRDLPPDPVDGTAPRNRVLLNQFGFRVGGPISVPGLFSGKDRAFFFVNYEEFRLPERQLRTRTILSPEAQQGIFRYGSRSVNLLALAAASGVTSTIDPTIAALLSSIRSSTSQGGVQATSDPNFQFFTFINSGGQTRRFPTVRFDFNLTEKHHLENIWNYQQFDSTVDFLNNVDPAFPGFPNRGSQVSNRFSNVTALRSTLTPSLVNEARFGLTGGTVLFFPEVSPAQFENQGGFSLGLNAFTNGSNTLTNATVTNAPSRRNAPVWQFSDTLTYVRGSHSLNLGGNFTQINLFSQSIGFVVPTISFGVDSTDTAANAIFNSTNFPGASADQINQAKALFAVLTGRVTQIGRSAYLNEKTNQYTILGDLIQRLRQREYGLFVQDTWRMRPNLTLNYGVRWEVQEPPISLNDILAKTTFAGLFGVSGQGNLFKPGTLTGSPTQFTAIPRGEKFYNTDKNNFAPSLGIAWSPNWKSGLMNSIFGESGQSVFRAGYSMSFVREGLNVFTSIVGANPGGTISATRNITLGNLTPGTLFRDRASLGPPAVQTTPTYPFTGVITDSANAFDPNLKLGYVHSWTFGIQRELDKNTVFEARYVGTRGVKLWRQYNLNEVNTIENGLLNEFRLAQANLAANRAAGRGNTFAYTGVAGTSPLPLTLAYFSGLSGSATLDPRNYTSALFTDAGFIGTLATTNPNPISYADTLDNAASRRANALAAGLPANFLVVNPDKLGGSFVVDNGGHTWYDGLTLELRRRLSAGLLVQANYTLSKSFSDMYAVSAVVFSQYSTLRAPGLSKTLSPFDVRHSFKVNWIYELPFGSGRRFIDRGGAVDRLLGGWEFHGIARLQSGTPFNFGNVQLIGMNRDELQRFVEVRKEPNRVVFYLPDDVILNTQRAFNPSATTTTGYGSLGVPTGKFIAPPGYGNCVQGYVGQCGFTNLVLHGPRFLRLDMSVIKRIKFTERTNFELRTEFLNAINNAPFRVGGWTADSVTVTGLGGGTFGQLGNGTAYQDVSTTNDPGGRLIQFVLRFNF
jgi:hypothetical protein